MSPAPRAPGRLLSLDVFRGATIAGMILVNNAGDWGKTFAPLLHAEWHGWTPTDLVFPFFLFIVGVAIPLALGRFQRTGGAERRAVHGKILRRSALLFALGLLLIWYPFYTVSWERARIPGVLQRIALVYLAAALAYLHLRPRGRALLSFALLGGYWAAMKLVPVPGFGAGDLSPQGNLAFWIDHRVLGDHHWLYSPGPGDPEGILSTLPAIVSALAGIFAGEWLLAERRTGVRLAGLALAGLLAGAGGLALASLFPINKNLWSPTYVLFTSGFALLLLALCYWAIDLRGWQRWAEPFRIFGSNAILVYVGSGLLARTLWAIRWSGGAGEEPVRLQQWLYATLYEPALPDYWASLAWASTHVALWLAVAAWLDRKRIYLKI